MLPHPISCHRILSGQPVGSRRILSCTAQRIHFVQRSVVGHRYTFVVTTTDNVNNIGQGTAETIVTQVTKYYYIGSSRVAMRQGDAVTYLHTDHLGTVSIATNQSQVVLARTLNLPYGGVRWTDGTMPTDWGYTGQREPIGTGLVYLHARFYAPWSGRFVSADTVVPQAGNPQAWNRYSYGLNNPVAYIDPTGHFTEQAIYNYLLELYEDKAQSILDTWKADKDWWAMLSEAQAGDVLYGGFADYTPGPLFLQPGRGFLLQFLGSGVDKLEGVIAASTDDFKRQWFSLNDIRRGYTYQSCEGCFTAINWVGLLRGIAPGSTPTFWERPGYPREEKYMPKFLADASAAAASVLGSLASAIMPVNGAVLPIEKAVAVTGQGVFGWGVGSMAYRGISDLTDTQ